MFFLSSLTKEISLYPKDLSLNIKTLVSDKIRELEGNVVGNHGYIISIIEFNQTSKGKVDVETGRVNYKIMYKAITFRPVVGEILYTCPFFINEHGFFCKVGSLQIFISQHMMKKWKYNPEDNTWILIKDDKKSNSSNKIQEKESETGSDSEKESEKESSSDIDSEEISINKEQIMKIKIGEFIFIKIIAFRINSNEITALGNLES
jgi:DNA-directed RNA polymerase subunit E'/Rpb7